MKKVIVTFIFLTIVLFIFNQCSQDESNPVGSNDPVIDPITNIWTDTTNDSHTFDFTTYDSSVTRGIFFGTESHPDSSTSPPLYGFFDRTYIEFDVIWVDEFGINRRIKYKGNFLNSRRLNLQSSDGKIIVLSKN